MSVTLDARIPEGPIEDKWQGWLDHHRLVGPRQRGDHTVIVVGTGLAGASAAATLAGQGYRVESFCFQDSARRAHSIAAQGGINATKDYANEGDSVRRLFVDTMKGGDFRAREANVWRLAETSTNIIDQAVAQGVPFNREYGGMLATRSFGGVLVERTFYCRGQTGQQLLLGAYSALQRQVAEGRAHVHTRHEMLDVVLVDGQARGIIARDLVTGEIERHAADAVVLATGGYCNVYFLSTNAMGCNVTAAWRAHRRGAAMANPCFTQIHPTSIPASGEYQSKLTLMSESLRNDGRVWVPREPEESREPSDIPEADRYYFLEERYPRFGNLVPRDVASRAAKIVCDEGLGVGADRPRRLPRLPRRDLRAGRARDRGALREPVRALRADHRRVAVADADDDLPGAPLLDGRALGRLRAADDDPGSVRDRRGELLRPRGEPARRQRDDAVPRRRLLHRPAHGHQLALEGPWRCPRRPPGLRRGRARRPRADRAPAGDRRDHAADRLPSASSAR